MPLPMPDPWVAVAHAPPIEMCGREAMLCNANGYLIQLDGGATYVPDGLPVSFQQNGAKVCVMYTIYQDPRVCPCCGGTRMRIQQIARQ